LASSLDNLSQLLPAVNGSEAELTFRRVISLREKLVADSPSVRDYQQRLAMSEANLADLLASTGRREEAASLLRRAIALFETLAVKSPSSADCQFFLAATHNTLGLVLEQTGRSMEAEQEYRHAVSLGEKLAADAPSVSQYQRQLATSNQMLADLLQETGRTIEAGQAYKRAVAPLRKLSDAAARHELAWRLATIPDLRLRDPQLAVQLAKHNVEERPNVSEYWNALGVGHYRAGGCKAAIEALEQSMQLRAGGTASAWFFLAMAHWQQGEKDKAREWYDRAVEAMEKNDSKDHELRRFRAEATALMGLTQHPAPATEKKEENSKRPSKS